MEVIKIRLQAQHHSMADPLDIPKYRNAAHALYTVVKEEGFGAIYRGVSLTALRQGTNQAGKSSLSNLGKLESTRANRLKQQILPPTRNSAHASKPTKVPMISLVGKPP